MYKITTSINGVSATRRESHIDDVAEHVIDNVQTGMHVLGVIDVLRDSPDIKFTSEDLNCSDFVLVENDDFY